MIKRVYVAGSYNADNIVTSLDNMRIGMRKSLEVLLAGFIPFVPWFDYHFQLMLRENEVLTKEDYYRYSIAWLEVCDVVLVVNYREGSIGTKKEIEFAENLGIPVFYDLKSLCSFARFNHG
jgi:nucleoside 2-deoxyribosyltransferase